MVLQLRELRRMRGFSQREAARRSGIGVKSISTFESGSRIDSMKISQLMRLLAAYATSPAEFFGGVVELAICGEADGESALVTRLLRMPEEPRRVLVRRFLDMLDAAEAVISTPRPRLAVR